MKSTLIIAMLATLVACNSESKSSKSCTFNDEPTSCAPADSSPYRESNEVVVESQVTSAIHVDGKHIEFLENTHDYQEKRKNGAVYPCINSTDAGSQVSYKVDKDQLIILTDVRTSRGIKTEVETYSRLYKPGDKLIGTWMGQKAISKDLYINKFLTFGERSVKAVFECHYR